MAAARSQRETMTPIFVDLVHHLGTQRLDTMDEEDVQAFIPIFHLLGEWREPSAYRPIVHLLRRPTDVLDALLGDALTETSRRVLAGVFDGDLKPLFAAAEDKKADAFARASCMDSFVLIAHLHPEHRDAIVAFVRSFLTRRPKSPEVLLVAWTDAVADLGLEDMTGQVRTLFEEGRIAPMVTRFDDFLEQLQACLDAGGHLAHPPVANPLITDAIEELSSWYGYSDAFFAEEKLRKARMALGIAQEPQTTKQLPTKIGRNDPCPCGSGKKFKKCCLHSQAV
jgi:hypothetical protein